MPVNMRKRPFTAGFPPLVPLWRMFVEMRSGGREVFCHQVKHRKRTFKKTVTNGSKINYSNFKLYYNLLAMEGDGKNRAI